MDAITKFIETFWRNLNLIELYEAYIEVNDREAAETSVKNAIHKLAKSEDDSSPLTRWCKDNIANDFKFLHTEAAMLYWTTRLQAALNATKDVWDIENLFRTEELIQQRKVNAHKKVNQALSSSTTVITDTISTNAAFTTIDTEKDDILFGLKSPGTIIKNYASGLLHKYKSLTDKEKYVVGISANGIIHLSDQSDHSQFSLFSEEEWNIIEDKYTKIPKLRGLNQLTVDLDKINKAMKENDLVKSYGIARKLEVMHLQSSLEVIYSIYAHIINVYRKRRSILNLNETNSTEWDAFGKIWSEVLEALVGNENVYIKWGESISESSKEEMEIAGMKKKIKGYKVDCRVVSNVGNTEHDLVNCEAARFLNEKKVLYDRMKLLIETRCNLDHLFTTCPTADPNNVYMHYLQICGNKCDVNLLRLVGPGLYVSEQVGSLNIPLSFLNLRIIQLNGEVCC